MAVSTYNDATPVNGPVQATGKGSPSVPDAVAGGTDAGGTESPRVETQTKQAGYNSTPSRSDKVPSGVDSYSDSEV